jgi:hypothetical protein
MDPDKVLADLRELVADWSDDDGTDAQLDKAESVVETFRTLDEWLSRGGFLPAAWRPTRDDDYSAEAIDRTNEDGE